VVRRHRLRSLAAPLSQDHRVDAGELPDGPVTREQCLLAILATVSSRRACAREPAMECPTWTIFAGVCACVTVLRPLSAAGGRSVDPWTFARVVADKHVHQRLDISAIFHNSVR
jgi:hypothetical protein